jgi:RNA polymerase II subunit A C-terminal domain phosphatase
MIHDNTALTVSEDEANQAELEAKRRLLASKRLSLVVDLDQTIIHATVDPTVAEWKNDADNPNYDALKDVRQFQLVDDGPGGRGTWYYIKLRPGLKSFLENVSKMYELHIYTMGTRAYAQHIAELIDPDRKIFGDRILSRDESGSLVAKNLQRIFPVDTNMVVVIDDRGDVWNWNANLIKVTQFSFFVGIGDINSSFLPKRPKIRPAGKSKAQTSTVKTGGPSIASSDITAQNTPESQQPNDKDTSTQPTSAIDHIVAMGGGDNPAILQEQTAKQDEALAAQLQERPLLQMQKQLDAEDESDSDVEKPRHHLLNDDDNELYHLEASLRKVHTEFFDVYARNLADVSGGRLAELRGSQSSSKRIRPSDNLDLAVIPDVKTIMPSIKARTFAGVSIVFSGVIPIDTDTQSSEIAIWARSFGARIQDKVSGKSTTHVVAARNRTAKVRQAVRKGKGRIKIVSLQWLLDSIVQWTKLDETPYLLSTEAEDLGRPFPGEDEVLSESEDIASSHETDTDANNTEPEDVAQNPLRPARIAVVLPKQPDLNYNEQDVLPSDINFDDSTKSPGVGTKEDWDNMNDELAEFLGSDAEDSDVVSTPGSTASFSLPNGKHRREETDDEGATSPQEDHPVTKRSRKIPRTEDSPYPTPAGTARTGADGDVEADSDDDGGYDSDWKKLEDEFERELGS